MGFQIMNFCGGTINLSSPANIESLMQFFSKNTVINFKVLTSIYGNDGTEMTIISAPMSKIVELQNHPNPLRYGDYVVCPDENGCGGYIAGPNGMYRYEKVK